MRSNVSVAVIQMSLSKCWSLLLKRAPLTLHSAQNERLDAVEFHVRCQVEVVSGVLVNLKDNVQYVTSVKSLAGREQRLLMATKCQGQISVVVLK